MSEAGRSQAMYKKGRIIVYIIAALNVVSGIYSAVFTGTSIMTLFIQIVASVALYAGVRWARLLFIIASTIILALALLLFFLQQRLSVSQWAYVAYLIASIVLLASNKNVTEFFKPKKHQNKRGNHAKK